MSFREANYVKSTIIECLTYLIIPGFIFGIAISIGFILKGFEGSLISGEALKLGSYLSNTIIYLIFLVPAMSCIAFPIMKLVTLGENQHPSTAPNPTWHRIFTMSYIHSPEENSPLWDMFKNSKKNPVRWIKNPLKLLVVSFLVFGIYALLVVGFPQFALTSAPQFQLQQVTTASEVTFSSLIPAFTENGTLLFFFQLFAGITCFILAKFGNKKKNNYYFLAFFLVIFFSFFWMGLHSLVYGNEDIAKTSTLIFGFISLLVTYFTASCIPFLVFHILNNFAIILSKLATTKSDLLIVAGFIWFLFLAITIGIWWYKRKKNRIVVGIPN